MPPFLRVFQGMSPTSVGKTISWLDRISMHTHCCSQRISIISTSNSDKVHMLSSNEKYAQQTGFIIISTRCRFHHCSKNPDRSGQ